MVELHNDEAARSDPLVALCLGTRAMELLLGETPGGGVKVTHFSITLQIHLAPAPLVSTLKSLASVKEMLAKSLIDYQVVSGVTPSPNLP